MRGLVCFLLGSRQLILIWIASSVICPTNLAHGQTDTPQCLELASAPKGTQVIASVLKICDQLKNTGNTVTKRWEAAEPTSGMLTAQIQVLETEDSLTAQQLVVNLNVTRAILAINEALLHLQQIKSEDDTAAYNRAKILNAVLGTSIGIIGSSLQFSNNVTTQHVGDAISVTGGAVTVAFALCTAELKKPKKAELESAADGTVGQYIKLMNEPLYNRLKKQSSPSIISCHFHDPDKELMKDVFAQLHEMNQSAADLLIRSEHGLRSP